MWVPPNGWFTKEIPIKMDDLGAPPFMDPPKVVQHQPYVVAWRPGATSPHPSFHTLLSRGGGRRGR